MSEQPAEALALPVELACGPSVDVWAPTATLLPSLDDDTRPYWPSAKRARPDGDK